MSTDARKELYRKTVDDFQTTMAASLQLVMDRDETRLPMVEFDPPDLLSKVIGDDPVKARDLLESLVYNLTFETYSLVVIPGYAETRARAEEIGQEFYRRIGDFSEQASAEIDQITGEGQP